MRSLLFGEFFVNIGRAVLMLTFAKFLYDETGELWAFSVVFLSETILSFVIPMLAGSTIDSKGSKITIRTMSFISFLCCLASYLLLEEYGPSVLLLLFTSVLLSFSNPFIKLSVFSLTPELSSEDELEKNNGKLAFSFQLGQLIGMVAAAVLLSYFKLGIILLSVSFVFLLSFICYYIATIELKYKSVDRYDTNIPVDSKFLDTLKTLVKLCRENGSALFLANLDFQLIAVFNLLLAAIVFNHFDNNPIWLSGLDASFAVGAIIGGFVIAKGIRKSDTTIFDSLRTQAVFLVLLFILITPEFIYFLPVALITFGLMLSYSTVYWNTTLQKTFPTVFKGRLAGVRNLVSSIYIGLSTVIVSFFHEISFEWAVISCVALVSFQVILMLFFIKKNNKLKFFKVRGGSYET